MQLIIISGPSGSGKTTLSKQILKNLRDGIILNTDNYYKTGIISKILSIIINSYFDRKISFNYKLFKKDLEFVLKNRYSNHFYKYNFKKKTIKKIYHKKNNLKFVVIEGIFGNEAQKISPISRSIFIKLNTTKKSCMKRVIKRDFLERGKNKVNSKRDFLMAWKLFHENNENKSSKNYLKKIVIKKKVNIKLLTKRIVNISN